jgi:hypothetical protein
MSKKKSLRKEDIVSETGMSRRSMLGVVGGGLALGATSVVLGPAQRAKADDSAIPLVSDSDTGQYADPADKPRSGHTDRDTQGGPDGTGDPGGYGVCRRRGHSDSDSGGSSDAGGQGRGPCR